MKKNIVIVISVFVSAVLVIGAYGILLTESTAQSYNPNNIPVEGNGVFVCEKSYPSLCIPKGNISLTCNDLLDKDFEVKFDDPNNFDPDDNGIGCEND